MQRYYEKVLNGLQRPILLVAVSIVALLSASGVAIGVTSTDGRNAGHAVNVAAAASPTSTAFKTVQLQIPEGAGTKVIKGSARFNSPVTSAAVVLNGFKLDYLTVDHHTDIIQADANTVSISPADTVNFNVVITHADQNHDDRYKGDVTVVVIANVQ